MEPKEIPETGKEVAVRDPINTKHQEIAEKQTKDGEITGADKPKLAKTVKLMERLQTAEVFSTPDQSKKFLNSLSYDDFKKWISFVNGVERGIPRSERGQVSDSHVQSENPLMGTDVEYQPPHKDFRDRLLKMAFEKAQSVDDPKTAALILGLSINAIHYFADGNGRTARITYALLSRGYNGSQEDQLYYSSLLEKTKGREVVNPNPAVSGVDKKIRSEMFIEMQKKSGFAEAFGDKPPTYVLDGYPNTMAGEYSPDEIATGDEIDATGRLMLYHTMESGGMTMISLMTTFGPDRVKDFVRTSPDGVRTFIDGNAFLPTLTQEEIIKWWNNSERAIAIYVQRLINVTNRDDVVEIASHYESLTGGAPNQETAEGQAKAGEITGADSETVTLKDMTQEQLSVWFDGDNIHNASHFMSPADNDRYQELCGTDLKEAIRFLRDKWGEYADRDFIQSFALVHWVGNSESGLSNLEQMLDNSRHEVEISTQAYRDEKTLKDNPRWLRAKFGVLVDGRVNLASNADIQTNQWHGLMKDDTIKRRKYTEWANRLMTNDANCVSPYEFAVDNWKVVGIMIDPDTPDIEKVVALAKKYGLPVIDTRNNDLFTKQTTVAPTTPTT